ncbi:MAG: ABC transporter ATP-binding protein [Clostridiales bacterium]|nr:ABC transporter ATP-binding protein [Clostridiales bacterium]
MIDVRFVTVRYAHTTALDSVRLMAGPGEIIGLFGANGAGKTTLLKCLAGLMDPTYGSVQIDGQEAKQSRKISYMAQEGSSFPAWTVAQHRDFFCDLMPDFRPDRFDRLVRFFDLPAGRKLTTFSTGQRASFELCCGLGIIRPYYVMDEPFLGHDTATRQNTLRLLAGLLGEKDTLILSTHQVQEAEPLISRAVVLDKGVILADVPMEELRSRGQPLVSLLLQNRQADSLKLEELLAAEWDETT